MAISNFEIAEQFDRLADLLAIEGANPFRVRAYQNAARTLRNDPKQMVDRLRDNEDLSRLPDIGEDLAQKIAEFVQTGRMALLATVEARTPPTLRDLLRVEGLGPKRVAALHRQLNIQTVEDLERAARSGRISALPGFSTATEQKLLAHLQAAQHRPGDFKLSFADEIAEPLLRYLDADPRVAQVAMAGSVRRRKETVGDLDIVAATRPSDAAAVIERFTRYDGVTEVPARGPTRCDIALRSGLLVNLRVVPSVSFGAALNYFTGARAHTIALRRRAVKKRLKLNEYGLYSGQQRIAGKTEQSIYAKLGLPYIEPELRENRGELDVRRPQDLPRLIGYTALRGDLHCHTSGTDGLNSLSEMAAAAQALGYEYLAITDHSKRLTVANGFDGKRLRQQLRAIDHLNARLDGLVLLKGIEVDVLETGKLDLPDSVLKELDCVVCAVHHLFRLSKAKQTERILRALDNPYVNILAHPSGRLIHKREPYELDLGRVIAGARERGCFLELNAQPERLDLNATACRMAQQLGLRVAISSDAHSTRDLRCITYGIDQARRGWLEAKDVLNTLPLTELRKCLQRR